MRTKLGTTPVPLQLPMGAEAELRGSGGPGGDARDPLEPGGPGDHHRLRAHRRLPAGGRAEVAREPHGPPFAHFRRAHRAVPGRERDPRGTAAFSDPPGRPFPRLHPGALRRVASQRRGAAGAGRRGRLPSLPAGRASRAGPPREEGRRGGGSLQSRSVRPRPRVQAPGQAGKRATSATCGCTPAGSRKARPSSTSQRRNGSG